MSTYTADVMDRIRIGRAVAAALDAVRTFIRRFVVLTEVQATVVALWIAHTHAIEAADCTPYLQVTSATKRSGKTRFLEVAEPLVPRPWLTGRTSAAALVRKIDAERPTLLLDESDAAFGGEREYAEALRGVLNTGYRRSGKATICVGQGAKMSARDFGTFSAKAIAGIGKLPDTVADRAIPIALRRRKADEECERWRARDGHAEAYALREAMTAAVEPLLDRLRDARPTIPPGLGDRQADVWEPLLALAEAAGDVWTAAARSAALQLVAATEDEDVTVTLLTDIRSILARNTSAIIPTKALLDALVALDDRPWATWRRGEQPITGRRLADWLKPLGIAPRATPDGRARGYRRDAFEDAFARYLPIEVSNRKVFNNDGPNLTITKCQDNAASDMLKSEESPISSGLFDGLTLRSMGMGSEPATEAPAGGEPLLTRLRDVLATQPAPLKAYELARVVGAKPDRVHRTLRQHPEVFTRKPGVDHVDAWVLRPAHADAGEPETW